MALLGSLVNNLMAAKQPTPIVPIVGMGATMCGWSDRHAYTIVEITNPKTIVVQQDIATRTDSNGMSECQNYDYSPDPSAPKKVVTLRKNGRWVERGGGLWNGTTYHVGYRSEYYDFSF